MSRGRLSPSLSGLGALLGATMAIELVLLAGDGTLTPEAVVTFVSSIPFVAILLGAGYWLPRSELSAGRHRRIAAWTLGGFGFLGAVFGVIAVSTTDDWRVQLSMVRWAVSIGAGTGVLVGIFEARAIERAVATERAEVRNRELRRRNERLDELASILSHDLRNPLNVAMGNLELLAGERTDRTGDAADDGTDRVDRVETAVRALERMEQLLSETLTLARSGQVVEEFETVRLADVVAESWANVATGEATLVNEADGLVEADGNRLKQLLENLFRNAVEHGSTSPRSQTHEDAVEHGSTSPRSQTREDAVEHGSTSPRSSETREDAVEHGGVDAVTVRVRDLPSGFVVEDDGVGIPEEQRSSVFRASVGSEGSGAGFGLAIVKQIAEAHGWEVVAAEGSDGGARFEVTGVDRRVADGEADDVGGDAANA